MSLDYGTTSYPKNMSYHMERIVNYSKQTVKIWCDRTGDINHQETIRYKLPSNCLVDLDSLIWKFHFTTIKKDTVDNNTPRYFPRNSSSIIDAIYVYANGNLIDPTTYYNHLYNLITDMSCGTDFHQSGIRYLENTDPSLKTTMEPTTGVITRFVASQAAHTNNDTDIKKELVVRNWLGFLGSASTRVIDTSLLGDVVIEIRLAEPTITFVGSTNAGITPPTYTINGSTSYMSVSRISFGDSIYYDLLRRVVSENGLMIGYKTYTSHRGNNFTKAAGTFTHSFNVNSNHLTKLIGTTLRSEYQGESILLNTDQAVSFEKQLNEPTCLAAFNQSVYFRKDASGLGTAQWDINGVSQYQQPLTGSDVFDQNLIALNLDSDVQSGVHPGMFSTYQFLKYYFCNILSFEHIQNSNEFVLEGLDGKASAISCKWTLNFSHVGEAGDLIPLVFAEKQQVLNIGVGQNLQIF